MKTVQIDGVIFEITAQVEDELENGRNRQVVVITSVDGRTTCTIKLGDLKRMLAAVY